MEEKICLIDSCTINTILRETKYFQTLTKITRNILTIAGRDAYIVGSRKATIILPMCIQLTIKNVLLHPNSIHTLLSYRDIRKNELHIVTHEENNEESILITKSNGDDYDILERIPYLLSRLYCTYIKLVPHVAYKGIFQNVDAFQTWYDRLGHPDIEMMRKIIENCIDHNLKEAKKFKPSDFNCTTCATEKLIFRPSPLKIHTKALKFLQRI
jgi:uncharacterized protein YbaR (Trm112 family)